MRKSTLDSAAGSPASPLADDGRVAAGADAQIDWLLATAPVVVVLTQTVTPLSCSTGTVGHHCLSRVQQLSRVQISPTHGSLRGRPRVRPR